MKKNTKNIVTMLKCVSMVSKWRLAAEFLLALAGVLWTLTNMFFWKYILDGIVEKVSFSFIAGEKIAIARVYTGNSGVLVLDEPSSALDPIS